MVAPPLTFLPDEAIFTNISFTFEQDGIALETNETFSVTINGLDLANDLVFGAETTLQLDGTIIDMDGEWNSHYEVSHCPSIRGRLWANF